MMEKTMIEVPVIKCKNGYVIWRGKIRKVVFNNIEIKNKKVLIVFDFGGYIKIKFNTYYLGRILFFSDTEKESLKLAVIAFKTNMFPLLATHK